MEFCTECGHELGVGRFCTNCGHPIDAGAPSADDSHNDTAERPAIAPPPPPPRYAAPPSQPNGIHRGRTPWLPWAMLGAILLLVAALGIVLLTVRDNDTSDTAKDQVTSDGPSLVPTTASASPSATLLPASPTFTAPSTPPSTPQVKPRDVARFATAIVPDTAPPNLDVDGNQVRYQARNMLDGVPETCWRMPGDGTGSEITIQLAGPTTLTRIGLINGYAKSAIGAGGNQLNWYTGNRRIQAVEWVFDDGTVLAQNLTETRQMQSVEVDEITTSTIRLRLLSVSAPGTGQAARDYTAISDLTIVGVPGG